jgi:hypothetical protein
MVIPENGKGKNNLEKEKSEKEKGKNEKEKCTPHSLIHQRFMHPIVCTRYTATAEALYKVLISLYIFV